MRKIQSPARDGWEQIIYNQGLVYSEGPEGKHYWDEHHAYVFSPQDVNMIRVATHEVMDMCYQTVQRIMESPELLERAGFDSRAAFLVANSWYRQSPSLFDGRIDFMPELDTNGNICGMKFLELNAETPTAIVESMICQREWFNDVHGADSENYQFNKLREAFVNSFSRLRTISSDNSIYLASVNELVDPTGEDFANISAMAQCAQDAGWDAYLMYIDDLHARRNTSGEVFAWGVEDHTVNTMYKIYPWELMLSPEEGLDDMIDGGYSAMDMWLEPLWKGVAGSKIMLPVMWDMFKGTDRARYCVPAYFADDSPDMRNCVYKPYLGHEGSGIVVSAPDSNVFADNSDDTMNPVDNKSEYIVQEFMESPKCCEGEKRYAIIGAWSFEKQCVGFDIRDSDRPVIDADCTFVPHMTTTED